MNEFVYAICPTCGVIPFSCVANFVDLESRQTADKYKDRGFEIRTGELPADFVKRAGERCSCRTPAASEWAALLTASPDNEGTDYPLWAIGKKYRDGFVWYAGPWFDRQSAERFLAAKRHNYDGKTIVYCLSGGQSQSYRKLIDLARKAQGTEASNA